ncbi:MAG TPA: hypothetical protein ENO23_03290, partial [Alphaproteobacteria bacterium]|nr:hypothetical protein [Alphaproteobacteria bacterium]
NKQRESIYDARRSILFGEDQDEAVRSMIEETVYDRAWDYLPQGASTDESDLAGFVDYVYQTYDTLLAPPELPKRDSQEVLAKAACDAVFAEFQKRREALGPKRAGWLERVILLQTIDARWKDHLYAMDHLREGIGFRAYAERDPLVEYQREGFDMFAQMMGAVHEEAPSTVMRVLKRQLEAAEAAPADAEPATPRSVFKVASERHDSVSAFGGAARPASPASPVATGPMPSQGGRMHGEKLVKTIKREGQKVGRNDPCPCGSGKKYKKCCGAS